MHHNIVQPSASLANIDIPHWQAYAVRCIMRAAAKSYRATRLLELSHEDACEWIRQHVQGQNPHLGLIEHVVVSADVTCSRACSHQLVRHRMASFVQESQRFCDYKKKEPAFIKPFAMTDDLLFDEMIERAMTEYEHLRAIGLKAEDARCCLPNCMATQLYVTMNLRSWRHFFEERVVNKAAQSEIAYVGRQILTQLNDLLPCCFSDIIAKAMD